MGSGFVRGLGAASALRHQAVGGSFGIEIWDFRGLEVLGLEVKVQVLGFGFMFLRLRRLAEQTSGLAVAVQEVCAELR